MTGSSLSETPNADSVTELSPSPSLTRRVRVGMGWTVSSSAVSQIVGFLRTIILARILVPEEFGLFGMALTVMTAISAFSTFRFEQTIISNSFASRSELETSLNTLWTAELIRSAVIALLLSTVAYPIARFYGERQLTLIVPVFSFTLLFQGFQNIGMVLLNKEIRFARLFWFEFVTTVAGAAVTIALGLVLRNVWALVFGFMATSAIAAFLSYLFHPYRPRLMIDRAALRRGVEIGKYILIAEMAAYVLTVGDNIVVGRFLGAAALGVYYVAYSLATAPHNLVGGAMGRALFPAYAQISADQPERLKAVFLRVFSVTSLILLVLACVCFLLADEIVGLLFGPSWTGAAPVLRVLAISFPLRGVSLITSTVLFALNRPRYMMVSRIVEPIIFVGTLIPLVFWFGLTGAALAVVTVYAVACFGRLSGLRRVIPGIGIQLTRTALFLLVASAIGFAVASLSLLLIDQPLLRLVAGGCLATVIPTGLTLILRPDLRHWIFGVMRGQYST